ncbi:MAG: methyltransferase domain-containing protein [Candidatus Omnitrophica bacterium]|nr:methyltransferase domain-containing protein [Candidatus Omnitrophota bacterium]
MGKITSKAYDDRILEQGLQFQIDSYYEPKDVSMIRRVKTIVGAIGPKPGERILDIGCGVGTFAYRCAWAGALSIGIDYSIESIKAARALSARYGVDENTGFVAADGKAVPFKDLYFDKIVAADFIEHITDEEKREMLEEIKRLLKPEGIAVIFTPNGTREKIGSIYWKIQHALFGKKIPVTELHFGLTTKADFERLCRKCGLAFRLSYEDTTRPYLAFLPFIRRFLALNLLWVLKKDKIRNVLAVNLGGIGDVLFSTPALRALKGFYPNAEISMLLDPKTREIAVDLPYVTDTYILHRGFPGAAGLWKLPENITTLLALRKKRFGLALNMRTLASAAGAFKMRMLLAAIGPRVTAGRNTEGRGTFFDIAISETDEGQMHEMEYDLELAGKLGAKSDGKKIDYEFTDEGAEMARKVLKEEAAIADSDQKLRHESHKYGRQVYDKGAWRYDQTLQRIHIERYRGHAYSRFGESSCGGNIRAGFSCQGRPQGHI